MKIALRMESAMKTIAALIAGLLLSLTTFIAGLALALTYLNAGEPGHRLDGRNTASLWSTEPVSIDRKSQSFERLPARILPKAEKVAANHIDGLGAKAIKTTLLSNAATVDPVTTGAIEDPTTDPAADTWRSTAHAAWCARRYRSYNAEDNSYRPYGGGRRACESPYSGLTTAKAPGEVTEGTDPVAAASHVQPVMDTERRPLEQVAYEDSVNPYADGDHVQSCFDRYRSYRPEDNSYQPFDGGPRRQCR
jgi:hypothetical protein